MTQNKVTSLTILLALATIGCADAEAPSRGELMFGLEPSDVEELHARYLEDEDIELTFDRLTAPFRCDLYDDLCEQVGERQAIAITAGLVDLALDEASSDEIEAYLDEQIEAAMVDLEAQDLAGTSFRSDSSSAWAIDQVGVRRLRVRNGISTPLIGTRKAWTEANTQVSGIGTWQSWDSSQLCVNAGTNNQVYSLCGGGAPCTTSTFDSINPSNSCTTNDSWFRVQTSHERNNGKDYAGGFFTTYTLHSRGCATATLEGTSLSACGPGHSRDY